MLFDHGRLKWLIKKEIFKSKDEGGGVGMPRPKSSPFRVGV
jgi:hypothetical protein